METDQQPAAQINESTEAALKKHQDKLQRIVQKLGLYVMKQRA